MVVRATCGTRTQDARQRAGADGMEPSTCGDRPGGIALRGDGNGRRPGRLAPVGRVEEFLSHDRDVIGGLDAEPDDIAAQADDRDPDLITDDDRLVELAAEMMI